MTVVVPLELKVEMVLDWPSEGGFMFILWPEAESHAVLGAVIGVKDHM